MPAAFHEKTQVLHGRQLLLLPSSLDEVKLAASCCSGRLSCMSGVLGASYKPTLCLQAARVKSQTLPPSEAKSLPARRGRRRRRRRRPPTSSSVSQSSSCDECALVVNTRLQQNLHSTTFWSCNRSTGNRPRWSQKKVDNPAARERDATSCIVETRLLCHRSLPETQQQETKHSWV